MKPDLDNAKAPVAGSVRAGAPTEKDWEFQAHSLQEVSRTFALTIPQLDDPLEKVVGNAYLLCRIADTIEDCPAMTVDRKRSFYSDYLEAAAGSGDATAFGASLGDAIRESMTPGEVELVENAATVIRIMHSFSESDQVALLRCLRVMAEGMESFQEGLFSAGLDDMPHMDAYCYHVAGVVGEMLTELFCSHAPDIGAKRDRIAPLAVSFGQGLQMTNILKDIWEDHRRGVCWLPRATFEKHGCSLDNLDAVRGTPEFTAGTNEVIAVAHGHLANALDYALHIPPAQRGVRLFCLWALFMAIHTLAAIHARPDFAAGGEVKISRRTVGRIVWFTRIATRHDGMLRMAFSRAGRGLPAPIR